MPASEEQKSDWCTNKSKQGAKSIDSKGKAALSQGLRIVNKSIQTRA